MKSIRAPLSFAHARARRATPPVRPADRAAHREGVVFLIVVIVAWGVTWPVNKLILETLSPLWMMALRSAIATVALFAIAFALGRLAVPPRADLPVLFSITLLHLVASPSSPRGACGSSPRGARWCWPTRHRSG